MIDIETGKPNSKENFKIKKPRKLSIAWNLFSDYSTIHGIKYLGEQRRHWTQRALLLVCFTLSIVVCGKLISEMHLQRLYKPLIISFAEETRKVSDIPFPTVSICLDSPTVDERILNYTKIYLHHEEYDTFNESIKLLDLSVVHQYFRLDVLEAGDKVKNLYVLAEQTLLDIFSSKYSLCHIGISGTVGNKIACNRFFQRTFTDGGFCYAFNYLESSKMFADNMADNFRMLEPFQTSYQSDLGLEEHITYPFRVRNSGESLNLHIAIPRSVQSMYCGKINGFKVHIHSGDDLARFKKHSYYIPLNQHGHFTIRPNIIETDDRVIKNYNKKQRKCVAENENNLMYFKRYTQLNCQLDKYIDHWIGHPQIRCAAAWMPHFNGTRNCIQSEIYIHENYRKKDFSANNFTDECFPACNSISYDVQLSTEQLKGFELHGDIHDEIKIDISFSHEQYLTLQRSETQSLNNFISNCGGILSLFMGVSMLSIVEIYYAWTLRVFCNLRNRNSSTNKLENPIKEKCNSLCVISEISELSDFYCEKSNISEVLNENLD